MAEFAGPFNGGATGSLAGDSGVADGCGMAGWEYPGGINGCIGGWVMVASAALGKGTVICPPQPGQRATLPAAVAEIRSSRWHCGQRNSTISAAGGADGKPGSVIGCVLGRSEIFGSNFAAAGSQTAAGRIQPAALAANLFLIMLPAGFGKCLVARQFEPRPRH